MRFAKETTVPVERSRAEIEETLRRYGADEFHSGWTAHTAMIAFRLNSLFIRFVLPIPAKDEKRFTFKLDRRSNRQMKRSDTDAYKQWDQEIRQRWRALLLVVKVKLEAVESGISTLEQEFLAFIVLPNNESLGEWLARECIPQIKAGQVPQLGYRPPAKPAESVADAEIIQ